MMTATQLQTNLSQCTGSEMWYRHSLAWSVRYTQGVKYLADNAGAYWLIDEIALRIVGTPFRRLVAKDRRLADMQFWRLTVNKNKSATLTCRADSDTPDALTVRIPYTDFPLDSIDIWAQHDGTRWTLLLPSEY